MNRKKPYSDAIGAAKAVVREHVSDATAAFVGGSGLRGQVPRSSNLDLIAVSNLRARPVRHNLVHDGWRVDLAIHTTESLLHRLQNESSHGVPRIGALILDSVGLLQTDQESELDRHTRSLFDGGPPPLDSNDSRERRFRITELVNELRQPRSKIEALASAGQLYREVANFILRANGEWGAHGKWIAREIERHDPRIAHEFERAFLSLANADDGHSKDAIRMVEDILEEHGGLLYDGYIRAERRRAPSFEAGPERQSV